MRHQRFACAHLSHPYLTYSTLRLLTEAAHGGLKPSPTGRLRRVLLHLSYSMALSRLLDTTPPRLLNAAAWSGLKPAPADRLREASSHLRYSITSSRSCS